MSAKPAIPLARLMAMAFRTIIDELHERLHARGWKDVRPAYGYVLLAARDASITGNEVAALMGVTKQAASKLIDAMEAAGYVRRREHPDDARSKHIELSARGQRLLATVESIYAEIEREWAAAIGESALERMRGDLSRALHALHDGELPAIRPTW
jgi:DNA-binding MarR family transcriptional regulator